MKIIPLFLFAVLLLACTPRPNPVLTSTNNVLEAFQLAGLEVVDVQPVDLPPGAIEAVKFYTPSQCDGCSSIVARFESEGALLNIKAILFEAGQDNEALHYHLYHNGRILLRIGGLIDEAEAQRYADVIGVE